MGPGRFIFFVGGDGDGEEGERSWKRLLKAFWGGYEALRPFNVTLKAGRPS